MPETVQEVKKERVLVLPGTACGETRAEYRSWYDPPPTLVIKADHMFLDRAVGALKAHREAYAVSTYMRAKSVVFQFPCARWWQLGNWWPDLDEDTASDLEGEWDALTGAARYFCEEMPMPHQPIADDDVTETRLVTSFDGFRFVADVGSYREVFVTQTVIWADLTAMTKGANPHRSFIYD